VGRFYFRRENYRSAKERLDTIYRAYPDAVKALGYETNVLKMMQECDKHIAEGEKKPSIWTRLGL